MIRLPLEAKMDDKLKALWEKIKQMAISLWTNSKSLIIISAILIFIIKFRDLLISLIISDSKKLEADAKKKDADLSKQENQANDEANKLVDKAKQESLEKPPVNDDWYKK